MTSDQEKLRDLISAWPTQEASHAQIQHMPAIWSACVDLL